MSTELLNDLRAGVDLTPAVFTVDQYQQMIRDGVLQDGDPIELLEGTLVYKDRRDTTGEITTHGGRHLKVLNKLVALLSQWVVGRAVFLQVQSPITLNSLSQPEPDCSLVLGTPDDFGDAVPPATAVLAVFEIADSSLGRDRRTKQRLYAEAAIPVYVIVNLKDNCIEVRTEPKPSDGLYDGRVTYSGGQTAEIAIGTFGNLSIPVQSLI